MQTRSSALSLFFVGAYAWTWTFNVTKILAQRQIVSVSLPFIVLDMAAGLGPLVAAVVLASYESGRAGRRALLGQLLQWHTPRRWYGVAILVPLAFALLAFGLWSVTGGSGPPDDALAQWKVVPAFFAYIVIFGGGVGEELGWRGYALPRLQQRYGALSASLLIGVVWALWHLPAWWTPGSGQDAVSFPVFVVSVVAASILLTSLYNSTGGSLPAVILAHTVFNLATTGPWARAILALPPEQRGVDPFNALTLVVGLVALGVVLTTDPRTLAARPRTDPD